MGFPAARYLGTEPKFSGGAISSLTGPGREGARLLISAPTQPGSSGSPVLTMDGTVVGIVTAAVSEEWRFCRHAQAARPLIVHADAVLSMSTRQGGQGQDMPSKGARCQSLEATIPRDELAVCQNGETKVAPVVDRAVKL